LRRRVGGNDGVVTLKTLVNCVFTRKTPQSELRAGAPESTALHAGYQTLEGKTLEQRVSYSPIARRSRPIATYAQRVAHGHGPPICCTKTGLDDPSPADESVEVVDGMKELQARLGITAKRSVMGAVSRRCVDPDNC